MSEVSHGTKGNGLFTKQNAALATLGVAGLGALAYAPTQLGTVAGTTAGAVVGVLNWAGTGINTLSSGLVAQAPVAGVLAPFAAPMLAGGYLGKKLGDIAGFESNFMKLAATGIGAFAGASFSASAAAPYITAVATGKLLYDGVNWARHRKSGSSAEKN